MLFSRSACYKIVGHTFLKVKKYKTQNDTYSIFVSVLLWEIRNVV